jgi:chromosome segregation ATPase
MEQDNELKRLEDFVENLLTRFTELRAEKAVLLQEIQERDEVIDGLRENVSSKDTERSEISLRVGKIVEQIEEWEQSLDDSEFEADSLPEEGSPAGEMSSEEDAETGVEDGKGQQNLFSMETS